MTYAPPTITALARYWTQHGGVNLGVVGDTRHKTKGTSYHLGRSDLRTDAYSRTTARDRAGLTDAASALDIGKLNGNLGQLRTFSRWFVERCRANAPGTSDVREFIYSPDGKTVLRWDRERGIKSAPRMGEANDSHLAHSHISFYRDSERRSKVGLFSPYFTPAKPAPIQEAPVGNRIVVAAKKQLDYFENEAESGDKAKAQSHAIKALGFVGRLIVSTATKAVAAVEDGPFSWAAARAGKVDVSTASPDTYGLLIQTVAVRQGWVDGPLPFADQAELLITLILAHGERYYDSDVYPVIPDDVLEAVMGTSDPTELAKAIAPYRAKLVGAPIEERPETTV